MQNLFCGKITNKLEAIDPFIEEVTLLLENSHLSNASVYALCLSIEEIASNLIKYGFNDNQEHEIEIAINLTENEVILEITDDGCEFDPNQAVKPDTEGSLEERALGGLGIHLVKKMSKSLTYNRKDNKNTTTVVVAN